MAAAGVQAAPPSVQPCQFTICFAAKDDAATLPDPARLLRERLRLGGAGIPATTFRNVHLYVGDEKVLAIAIKPSGEHVVLEDETSMFPSDKLVTAFQLLLKAA